MVAASQPFTNSAVSRLFMHSFHCYPIWTSTYSFNLGVGVSHHNQYSYTPASVLLSDNWNSHNLLQCQKLIKTSVEEAFYIQPLLKQSFPYLLAGDYSSCLVKTTICQD